MLPLVTVHITANLQKVGAYIELWNEWNESYFDYSQDYLLEEIEVFLSGKDSIRVRASYIPKQLFDSTIYSLSYYVFTMEL